MKRRTLLALFALVVCSILFVRTVPALGNALAATDTRTPTLTRTPTATRVVSATPTITRTPKPTLTPVSAADKRSTALAATQRVTTITTSAGLAPISAANLRSLADLGVPAAGDNHSTLRNVVFSPDGKLLASIIDNAVQLWNVADGSKNTTLTGHTDVINSVVFSPDGKLLASSSQDQTIRLWDVATGAEQTKLAGSTDAVDALAFSLDGTSLATCNGANSVLIWSVHDAQVWGKLESAGLCRSSNLAFSPDGKLLAMGDCAAYKAVPTPAKTTSTTGAAPQQVCIKGRIHFWDLGHELEDLYLDGGTNAVMSIAFNPSGMLLASGSCATSGLSPQGDSYCLVGEIRVWDVNTGKARATLAGGTDYVRNLAFSPDGTLLASSSCAKMAKAADGHYECAVASGYQIQLWAMPSGQLLTTLPEGESLPQNALMFSPDGTRLASIAGSSKAPHVWASVKPGVDINQVGWLPPAWTVSYVRPLRYNVNVGDSQLVEIGSCPYTGRHKLVLRVVQVTIIIKDVKTNRQIAAQMFTGPSPDYCPYSRAFSSYTDYQDGAEPDTDMMMNWVKGTLAAWGVKD